MNLLHLILILEIISRVDCGGGGSKTIRAGSKREGPENGKDKSKGHGTQNSKSRCSNEKQSLDDLANFSFRNASHEERLLLYLFCDYEDVARGVMDTGKAVEVSIDFVLLRIHGLDERIQVLTTTGLVIAEWTDERLTWKPAEFGNLTNIIVTASYLWKPELAVMNGAEELMPDFERIRVLLNYNGRVHWEPGGIFKTTCDMDIAFFPFDIQHCPLLIGAYSYYSSKMNITNASSEISTHHFRVNGEWHVYGTSAEWNITMLSDSGEGYSHVVFTLHLERRYKFYIMNVVLPCVMLSVLIMIGFCLPPDAGEKISLGISVLLAFTVFLLMIAGTIPRTSLAIPLIVTYLMATMTLGTLSICMTVLVLNVHHRGPRYRIPNWVRKLILVYLARLVCIRTTYGQQPSACQSKFNDIWKKRGGQREDSFENIDIDDITMTNVVNSKIAEHAQLQQASNGPIGGAARPRGVTLWQKLKTKKEEGMAGERANSDFYFEADGRQRRGSSVEEWHELAHVLDRVFFWLLFLLMTLSSFVILLYPKYTGSEDTSKYMATPTT